MGKRLVIAISAFWTLGCLAMPSQQAAMTLDYVIDRPRVVGIKLTPPLLVHGVPVTVDALVLAPGEVHVVSADLCGLGRELPTLVTQDACFLEPDLVEHLADATPFVWDPPDLSGVECPEWYQYYDTGPGETDEWRECASLVPLMVTAKSGEDIAYGRLDALFAIGFHGDPPAGIDSLPHSLDVAGEQSPGSDVELTFTIDAMPDYTGVRWYVDGGELSGTGRTTVHSWDGTTAVTHNTLTIPRDWQGPLRVAAVVFAADAFPEGHPGDITWSLITLDVR